MGEENDGVESATQAWSRLQQGLEAYLRTMVDPEGRDHLLLELPDPEDGEGCTPYVQVCGFGRQDRYLRAELSGNDVLAEPYRLDPRQCAVLGDEDWLGNDEKEQNWYLMAELAEAASLADSVVFALRDVFGIAHPQLLTYRACGPAAAGADVLGLCATAEVPVDKGDRLLVPAAPLQEGESVLDRHAIGVRDHDELVRLVAGLLREKYDEEPTRDDEGDFVLEHLGQHVYVRARQDQPVVQIFARVGHDVASRRSAAVEIALLNRDHTWSKWNLIGRGLFQTLALPATPFVPAHVWAMIDLFLGTMAETRDDLVLRTRAKVA